jgi:glycosyltransferase involved in cell wall biosynthesis
VPREISNIPVAIDSQIFASQKHGGISRYFSRIAPLLSQYGCEAKIIAPLYINAYLRHLPPELVWGMAVPQIPGAARIALSVDKFLARPLAQGFRARIVHETYYQTQSHAPKNAAIVLTVYDMIHELFPDLMADQNSIDRKASAIRRADRIICISESTKRDLLKFCPEVEDRASVILLGFDEQSSSSALPISRPVRPFLLHVGPRSAYKNFSSLLNAYAQSARLQADFDLVCIGGGKWTPSETNTILKHRLNANVHQFDASDEELQCWYRCADLFIYPSLYEGFGIPPLEAMAANCPVVAVKASSIPEVCGPAAMLAEEGSADALNFAIESVVYSPTLRDQLRAAGQARLKHFSWDRTSLETATIYREVA